MNKVKYIIVIVIILIVIVLSVLLELNKEEKDEENVANDTNITNTTDENYEDEETQLEEIESHELDIEEDIGYQNFFTIANCISQYLETINTNSSKYENVSSEDIQSNINALTSVNQKSSIQTIDQKYIFTTISVKQLYYGNTNSYAVYGFATDIEMNYIKDMYFVVNLDTVNNTFSVEVIEGNNLSLDNIESAQIDTIEKNEDNGFKYQSVDNEYKFKKYLEYYKRIMLCKTELAYEYLDETYKEERFGSYEDFEEYVQNNKDNIIGLTVKEYKESEDGSQLTVIDQNSIKHLFNITGTMSYSVVWDNYVILFDDDEEKYADYEEAEKVDYNIQRWIKMINHKDYKCAYEFLDETFREEKFGSVEEFANYMTEKYDTDYSYIYEDRTQEGNTYTAEIKMYNDEEFSEKYMTVILRLDDNTSFTMSFDD